MAAHALGRRELLLGSGAVVTTWMLLDSPWFAHAFPSRAGETVMPFLDQPPAPPRPDFNLLNWEELNSWITPTDRFFRVAHDDRPQKTYWESNGQITRRVRIT